MSDRPPGLSAADMRGAGAADQVSLCYERRRQSALVLGDDNLALKRESPASTTLGFLLLSFLQHKVRRLLSSLVLRHRKSKSGHVETGKQCFPPTEYDRCKCKVQGIYQPCLQILPHRGNTASDFDILVARCLLRQPQRLFDSAGDKVEGRPALH